MKEEVKNPMTRQIEAFFDYACPYCDDGIRQFLDILSDYPDVEVVWRPCEAHPWPERTTMHSNLAIQAMYCLRDMGGDLVKFHIKVFDAWFGQRKRIDYVELLSNLVGGCGGSAAGAMVALGDK
ncbi:MAG: DsbA family protein, partial [Clostridia bacterium]|nr:DsbA family protein [Clostridia bacterium]